MAKAAEEDLLEGLRIWPPSRLGLGAIFVGAVCLLVSAYTPVAAQGSPPPVILAEAKQTGLVDRLEALGTLRANEQVTITAQVTEIITEIKFEDGQRVKKGETLALMTNGEEEANLKEVEATVREALEQLERAKPLAKRGVSSEAVLSERRRNFETAIARLDAVKSRLADRRIEAPFAGVVGLRRISVGALVEPGTVITTIDDDSVMKLDFSVPATFLSTIRVGLEIEATAEAFDGRTFVGKVTGIDSRIDPVTRSVTVRAVLPNEDGSLKAGMLMTLEILKNRREAVVVPEKSVIRRGREARVLVVDPKSDKPVVASQLVELGMRTDGKVEVTAGLKAGTFVIVDGTLRVKAGQAVKITAIDDGDQSLSELLKQKAEKGT
ncbi:MAG: efflux RND transporter periplasmic adaptor subunit [Filomicrobium sp.]